MKNKIYCWKEYVHGGTIDQYNCLESFIVHGCEILSILYVTSSLKGVLTKGNSKLKISFDTEKKES